MNRQKIIYGLFAISLGLNIIALSGFGYARYHLHKFSDANWVEERFASAEERLTRAMSEADKQVTRAIFAKHRPALEQGFRVVRDTHHEAQDALKMAADSDRLVDIFERSQAGAAQINQHFHAIFIDLATELSPQARQRIAAHLRRDDD